MDDDGRPKKRVVLDRSGYGHVEVRNREGVYERTVDKSTVRKLRGDQLGLAQTRQLRRLTSGSSHHVNGKVTQPLPKTLKQRSSLDYMRALSEVIKKKRLLRGDGED